MSVLLRVMEGVWGLGKRGMIAQLPAFIQEAAQALAGDKQLAQESSFSRPFHDLVIRPICYNREDFDFDHERRVMLDIVLRQLTYEYTQLDMERNWKNVIPG